MSRLIDQSIARVRAYMKAKADVVTKSGFARAAGLSVNALADLEKPDWNPRAKTLRNLEQLIPCDFQPDGTGAPGKRRRGPRRRTA